MKESFKSSDLPKSGLQIFSSQKKKMSTGLRHPMLSSFTYPFLCSEETLYDGISVETGNGLLNQWKRLSERNPQENFHDYSPTVVGSEVFSRNGSIANEGETKPHWISNWNHVIDEIFRELPFDTSDQFMEEFQYAIVSSDCLNDTGGHRIPCSVTKSIMNFHKPSKTFVEMSAATIPTKYGRLRVCPTNNFLLLKTLDYRSTILISHSILRFLHKSGSKKHLSTKRIVSTVLIVSYLAIQQEFFYTQYTKYKALITLKKTLLNFQKFSALLSKYHLKYKELSVYKPITSEHINNSMNDTISCIHDLLSSTLDLFFYRGKCVTSSLLSVVNGTTLSKYCEIYALQISDLIHYFNRPAVDIEEKAKRCHILKKFMLCCLLSVNHSNISSDFLFHSSLMSVFSNFSANQSNAYYYNDTDKLITVTENMRELNDFVNSLNSSLNTNKSLLFSMDDSLSSFASSSSPEHQKIIQNSANHFVQDSHHKTYRVLETLNFLRHLEEKLLRSDERETSAETADFITITLQKMLDMWRQNEDQSKHTIPPLVTSSNRGFSLKVVQSPKAHVAAQFCTDKKTCLNSDIDFKHVDETQSDIELDSDQDSDQDRAAYLTKGNTENSQLNKYQGLSDKELRGKLNEGILRFAIENNQGKERLRTQKSFELLRNASQYDISRHVLSRAFNKTSKGNKPTSNLSSRSPYKSKISSEESIPVLYELKELLESH